MVGAIGAGVLSTLGIVTGGAAVLLPLGNVALLFILAWFAGLAFEMVAGRFGG